jgi:hypothetical protein
MVVHAIEPFNAEPPRGALADRTLTPGIPSTTAIMGRSQTSVRQAGG